MALSAYIALLALFGLERVAELVLSRRNARRAFARGAVETGAAHFRWMTLLHACFLPSCLIEAAFRHGSTTLRGHDFIGTVLRGHDFIVSPAPVLWAALALGAQGLRWWAIASLGDRWNVRVIVTPGDAPVRRGPYRFVRHPNYIAVIVELFALPLAGGAWVTAVVFSALNAAVLRVRIRDEERALGAAYARDFAQVPRFIPHG